MADRRKIVTVEIELKLSDEISDLADAADASKFLDQLEAAMIGLAARAIADGYRPVGNMKVRISQQVER